MDRIYDLTALYLRIVLHCLKVRLAIFANQKKSEEDFCIYKNKTFPY